MLFFLHHIELVGAWRHRNIFINASLLISKRWMQHLREALNGEFPNQFTVASFALLAWMLHTVNVLLP